MSSKQGAGVIHPIRDPIHLNPDEHRQATIASRDKGVAVGAQVLSGLTLPPRVGVPVAHVSESVHVLSDCNLGDRAGAGLIHIPANPSRRPCATLAIPARSVGVAGLLAIRLQVEVVVSQHGRGTLRDT